MSPDDKHTHWFYLVPGFRLEVNMPEPLIPLIPGGAQAWRTASHSSNTEFSAVDPAQSALSTGCDHDETTASIDFTLYPLTPSCQLAPAMLPPQPRA
eukprot:CAMPEP_0119109848 /NCGR_PEP_ID=MMETSP1180-20130426/24091_1 /TAXON_ID=3052 ORGANISM="Chlamydomonas cf sp, Strain CCMP681" /NCGR_SAMPLE_ID=MMETSP1180 /ASSEMBLY_ACC=CAM_ASM_000741 /LENGTH=96 /DNA_ID=CAMNT_0007095847 /DNA_START=558 /DNA_END=848 /DNA_ORIENTATION=+